MIDESLKAWRREPTDEEWHRIFHAGEPDPRCKFCREEYLERDAVTDQNGRCIQ